jgi:hypothetical protein
VVDTDSDILDGVAFDSLFALKSDGVSSDDDNSDDDSSDDEQIIFRPRASRML